MKKIKLNSKISIVLLGLIIIGIALGALIIFNNINITNKNINSIKIRYAYAYNVESAEALNRMSEDGNFIDILEINLEGEEFLNIQQMIEKTSFKKIDYLDLMVIDSYQIVVNDQYKLCISNGQEYAMYIKGNDSYIIEISEELVNKVSQIVQDRVSKSSTDYSTLKVTISKEFFDNKEDEKHKKDIEITNKKHINTILESLKYSKVNIKEEELEGEEIEYIIDLNNGSKVYTYHASVLGYILNENNEKEFVSFVTDFDYLIEVMYENYISGRNETLKANEIVVTYKDKEVKITDLQKVDEIIESLKLCSYFSPDYLDDFDETEYGKQDIIIKVGNYKYIIPGQKTLGNRYCIDENKKTYLVSSLRDLESYFKELVGYTE